MVIMKSYGVVMKGYRVGTRSYGVGIRSYGAIMKDYGAIREKEGVRTIGLDWLRRGWRTVLILRRRIPEILVFLA